jgi:hypothetical protein
MNRVLKGSQVGKGGFPPLLLPNQKATSNPQERGQATLPDLIYFFEMHLICCSKAESNPQERGKPPFPT